MSVRVDQVMATAAAAALHTPVSQELRTRYRQLRQMLHSSGLVATYAFIAAKSNAQDEIAKAYGQVASILRERLAQLDLLSSKTLEHDRVLCELGELPAERYARASVEATSLVQWLSRLADALYQEKQ